MAETAVEVKKQERAAPPAPMGPSAVDMWQSFRKEMDRLLDQFWRGGFAPPSLRRAFEPAPLWRYETAFGFAAPAVDVVEDDQAFRITAELPGIE